MGRNLAATFGDAPIRAGRLLNRTTGVRTISALRSKIKRENRLINGRWE